MRGSLNSCKLPFPDVKFPTMFERFRENRRIRRERREQEVLAFNLEILSAGVALGRTGWSIRTIQEAINSARDEAGRDSVNAADLSARIYILYENELLLGYFRKFRSKSMEFCVSPKGLEYLEEYNPRDSSVS